MEVLDPTVTNSNLAAAASQMQRCDPQFGDGSFSFNHFKKTQTREGIAALFNSIVRSHRTKGPSP
jgi:hypothetical protein